MVCIQEQGRDGENLDGLGEGKDVTEEAEWIISNLAVKEDFNQLTTHSTK